MLLSQQPEYLIAIPAAMEGDFDTARSNLEALIAKAQSTQDTDRLGYLWQTLGDVEARAGRVERASRLHEQAIALDPHSPLPYLFYAQGLWRAFGNAKSSFAMLKQAQEKLDTPGWIETPEELPRSYYEREFEKLRNEITNHDQ